MTLSTEHINEIRRSWQIIADDADWVVESFYAQLFRQTPRVARYFEGLNMTEQRRKLATALTLVVRHADSFGGLTPLLHELGDRHGQLGIGQSDYDAVGAALLHALETALGDEFSETTQEAWGIAYSAVAGTMMAGAAELGRKTA